MALETSSFQEVLTVISFLWTKYVYVTEIHSQLIEVYDDGIMRVWHVRI